MSTLEEMGVNPFTCTGCKQEWAKISIINYADENTHSALCSACALRLAKELTEDLCKVLIKKTHP
jgi:transcription elongation factor Elf1